MSSDDQYVPDENQLVSEQYENSFYHPLNHKDTKADEKKVKTESDSDYCTEKDENNNDVIIKKIPESHKQNVENNESDGVGDGVSSECDEENDKYEYNDKYDGYCDDECELQNINFDTNKYGNDRHGLKTNKTESSHHHKRQHQHQHYNSQIKNDTNKSQKRCYNDDDQPSSYAYRQTKRAKSVVTMKEMIQYCKLLDSPYIQMFLDYDQCYLISDKV